MDHSPYADRWLLDPKVVFLNHGSFGATPKAVLEEQTEIQRRIESEPLQFFDHHFEVPVISWPAAPKRLIRISAQIYNGRDPYVDLAAALRELVLSSTVSPGRFMASRRRRRVLQGPPPRWFGRRGIQSRRDGFD